MAASSMPSRSTTPGRKFCTSTSAVAARRFRISRPSPVLRSRVMERLLRLRLRNCAENPRCRLLSERVWSPCAGSSTLITSAPWSARIIVAHGPDSIEERSTTRMPAIGPIRYSCKSLRSPQLIDASVRFARGVGKPLMRGQPARALAPRRWTRGVRTKLVLLGGPPAEKDVVPASKGLGVHRRTFFALGQEEIVNERVA